jgi:hypothetical protein
VNPWNELEQTLQYALPIERNPHEPQTLCKKTIVPAGALEQHLWYQTSKISFRVQISAGGEVIWRQGGTVLLFRGRNYHWKEAPILEPQEDRSAAKDTGDGPNCGQESRRYGEVRQLTADQEDEQGGAGCVVR